MLSYFWDPKAARILSTILIFAAVLAFLHGSRETLTLLLFRSCSRILWNRSWPFWTYCCMVGSRRVAVTYLLIGGVVTALVLLLGPRISEG